MNPSVEVERYIIHEKIGEGAFGEVYRATHKLLHREVAIKFIKGNMSERARKRFIAEARAVARLNHPHILQVYDFDTVGENRYFMAMEYLPDGDLDSLIEQRRAYGSGFTLPDVILILKSVAVGLHHAHRQGVVHRDIKPSNIFFSKDHRIVVGDFGLAKQVDSLETASLEEGGLAGTPSYISPEQIQGEKPDPRSDIYALGVIMYQLIAGERPYKGEMHAVLLAHLQTPIPNILDARPNLPPMTATIINKAMAKKPEDRYQSMAQFMDDLNKLEASITDTERTLMLDMPEDVSRSLASLSVSGVRKNATHSKPAWQLVGQIAPLVLLLVLIVGAVAFGANGLINNDDNTVSTAEPVDQLANIAVADEDEVLILIAPMQDPETGIDLGSLIFEQINNGQTRIVLSSRLRLELLPADVQDSSTADQLGVESGADVVIWGFSNAAGWEVRMQGTNRDPDAIQDFRLFAIKDADYTSRLVQDVPLTADYLTRMLLVHARSVDEEIVDAFYLFFTFSDFTNAAEVQYLGQRPLDQATLSIYDTALDSNFIATDETTTQILQSNPSDISVLLFRWAANALDGRFSLTERDALRIQEILGPESVYGYAVVGTTYFLFGDGEQLLATIEPIHDINTSTSRFIQNQAVQIMIHNGDFDTALEYGVRDSVDYLGRLLLVYEIQGDEASIQLNLPDYLDQRADRFAQAANGFFQEVNPNNYHPAAFAAAAFEIGLEGRQSESITQLVFALSLHPDDYMLSWLLAEALADDGDAQEAYDRFSIAGRNAPVPFPIAFYGQAELVLARGDEIENPIEACKLLQQAQRLAESDPVFYEILLGRIMELQATACASVE